MDACSADEPAIAVSQNSPSSSLHCAVTEPRSLLQVFIRMGSWPRMRPPPLALGAAAPKVPKICLGQT
eukprot:3505972-Pyramimonas_sp.AAC.1